MRLSDRTSSSRRLRYSSRMEATESCGPFSASTAAAWEIDDVWVASCDCTLRRASMSGRGPSAYPTRHPVMAYVFESELTRTSRSRRRACCEANEVYDPGP